MQNHIALLRLGLEVRKTFPVHKVLGSGDTCARHCRRQVSFRRIGVFTLHAEDSVNPSVLVGGQPHVIDIDSRLSVLRHCHRIVPEAEIVDSVGALRDGEERLSVCSFHSYSQYIFPVPFDGSGVESGMDAESFLQIRISDRVQVIFPEHRSMRARENGILVSFINAVHINRLILFRNQIFIISPKLFQSLIEIHNFNYLVCYFRNIVLSSA